MVKVLFNSACSKSRAILEHLDENNVQFEIIDFIRNSLSQLELKTLLKKLGKSADELIRKGDKVFKDKFADKILSEEECFEVLLNNPSLIERPILIKGGIAMIGRRLQNVKFFIESYLK
jgi:arsenate reductase